MNDDQPGEFYRTVKTIATVGYSTQPARPAYYVPEYLSLMGYHVIPVNPTIQEGLGQKSLLRRSLWRRRFAARCERDRIGPSLYFEGI